jgi:succinate dehydrogenase/fumarate reductase flavoprotein subunit
LETETKRCDVLCVGGGIAGLMAAIRAAECGARVVVVDKANTFRSGAGATGNDHFRCYIPEVHGPDVQPYVEATVGSQANGGRTAGFFRTFLLKSFDIVKLWDSWGIPMRPRGNWEFSGQALPGRPRLSLKYAGQDQKVILTKEALKRGVEIVNRVMVFDLLGDGRGVNGAVGLSTRENKVVTFLAKAVFLGTGRCVRLYPSPTPGWMFNRAEFPANTGDGRAMAWRAGAELANMELPQRWAGPRYFVRCGKGTWIGVVRSPEGKPLGPYVSQPDRLHGDPVANQFPGLFADLEQKGQGPFYMDCRGISNEDYDYMLWGLRNEGNTALIHHLKEEGIDLRRDTVEFMTYELTSKGGIEYSEKGETTLNGLYAAGDEYFGGIGPAATYGYIAGENVAQFASARETPDKAALRPDIEEKIALLRQASSRQAGASWQEANIALSQIMQDYLGNAPYTRTMLEAGLSHLRHLRQKACQSLVSRNQHELTHCLEVTNLMDIGEIMFAAVLAREETRGDFRRVDFPFTNALLNNKELICRRVDGKIVTEWKNIQR